MWTGQVVLSRGMSAIAFLPESRKDCGQDSVIPRELSTLALLPESSKILIWTRQYNTQRALNDSPFTGKQQRRFGDRTASCPESSELLPFYRKVAKMV